MTPQPGVPAEECGAAVAAESVRVGIFDFNIILLLN